jgi:hypothetical protein
MQPEQSMSVALAGLGTGDPVQVFDDCLAAGSPGWAGRVVKAYADALEVCYAGDTETFALPDGRRGARYLRATGKAEGQP